jgi:hypothetical protein
VLHDLARVFQIVFVADEGPCAGVLENVLELSLSIKEVHRQNHRPDFGQCVVNPVRNSSEALNPAGIIVKSNPAAEQRGIISNGVNDGPVYRVGHHQNADISGVESCTNESMGQAIHLPV